MAEIKCILNYCGEQGPQGPKGDKGDDGQSGSKLYLHKIEYQESTEMLLPCSFFNLNLISNSSTALTNLSEIIAAMKSGVWSLIKGAQGSNNYTIMSLYVNDTHMYANCIDTMDYDYPVPATYEVEQQEDFSVTDTVTEL